MDLYSYLILAIVCLSPATLAECPDKCFCAKYRILSTVVLHVYCGDDLKRLPRDHISSDVTTLDLTSNKITVLANADERAQNMTQLKVLVLAKNNMTKIEVNSLRGFYSIVHLDLSHNNISNIPDKLFETLPNLKRFHLSYNPNLTLPENGFGSKELERLHIGYCNLKEIPLKFFDTMPNIKTLHLEGNKITHLGLNLITNFQNMTFVNLESNNLSIFQPEIVKLLTEHDVVIGLNGNPFACDCQFRDGYELYMNSHIMADSMFWYTESKHEIRCEIPAESKKNYSIDDQNEFLNSINCNISMNDETSNTNATISSTYSVANITLTDNMTSYNDSTESSESNDTAWDYEEFFAETYDARKWFTSYTTLWVCLGIVVFVVLFVGIVVIVKKINVPEFSEGSHQFGLLQSELEDG